MNQPDNHLDLSRIVYDGAHRDGWNAAVEEMHALLEGLRIQSEAGRRLPAAVVYAKALRHLRALRSRSRSR
ncbi:hypothetical protein KVP10_08270 [Candidimonas humi]|uniref:Type II toxin-antitoxin system ParD family antitoxin n=1 Tax=Candidimonas humi TaxID=683355 RepID=A0ABV8NYW2_9BURK|nr:hypothetical protein [Candidimonas humi]MBV6304880.1 hypothetical protein [Candidimonas humi]